MARTREFDENAVIQAATCVFWDLGFDGASMPDILNATGLSRSSLYETFGDKRSLFLRTVEAYTVQAAEKRREAFTNPEGLKAGIASFLHSRIAQDFSPARPAGCYLTSISATLRTADEELRTIVTKAVQDSERDVLAGFTQSLAKREIPDRLSAEEWASLFLALTWGLNVAARMRRPQAMMEKMINGFLAFLDF